MAYNVMHIDIVGFFLYGWWAQNQQDVLCVCVCCSFSEEPGGKFEENQEPGVKGGATRARFVGRGCLIKFNARAAQIMFAHTHTLALIHIHPNTHTHTHWSTGSHLNIFLI